MGINLVTEAGLAKLQEELKASERRRPEIKERLEEARGRGDLSENAEYHAAREELAVLESKVRELEELLRNTRVLDQAAVPADMVMVGMTVLCEDLSDGTDQRFRLVGDGEQTGMTGEVVTVSVSSPVGQGLFKARLGDKIVVQAPRGKMKFRIKEIVPA